MGNVSVGRHQWDETGKQLTVDLAWGDLDTCIDHVNVYRMPHQQLLGCSYAVRVFVYLFVLLP